MDYNSEHAAAEFLELASQQRLSIITRLLEQRSNVSTIAKALDATVPEVYRNFERLVKAELIAKDVDGNYYLTTYGKTICSQIPSLIFLSQNKNYFRNHDFGDMPTKFIQRIGALVTGQHIKGFIRVQECQKEIYTKAEKYVYNILAEVSYSADFLEPLVEKLKKSVTINSIFSELAIVSKERKKVVEKHDFKKFIDKGMLERRMKKDVKIILVLNEKDACIIFPSTAGDTDMSEAFYGSAEPFHEWCLDYFNYCWQNAGAFQETKLNVQ